MKIKGAAFLGYFTSFITGIAYWLTIEPGVNQNKDIFVLACFAFFSALFLYILFARGKNNHDA